MKGSKQTKEKKTMTKTCKVKVEKAYYNDSDFGDQANEIKVYFVKCCLTWSVTDTKRLIQTLKNTGYKLTNSKPNTHKGLRYFTLFHPAYGKQATKNKKAQQAELNKVVKASLKKAGFEIV